MKSAVIHLTLVTLCVCNDVTKFVFQELMKLTPPDPKPWSAYIDPILSKMSNSLCTNLKSFLKWQCNRAKTIKSESVVKSNGACSSCCLRYQCQRYCYEDTLLGKSCPLKYFRWHQDGRCIRVTDTYPDPSSADRHAGDLITCKEMHKMDSPETSRTSHRRILEQCADACEHHVCQGNCNFKFRPRHPKISVVYPLGRILASHDDTYPFARDHFTTWKFYTNRKFTVSLTFVKMTMASGARSCQWERGAVFVEEDAELNTVNCSKDCLKPDAFYGYEPVAREDFLSFQEWEINQFKKGKLSKFCGHHSTFVFIPKSNDVEMFMVVSVPRFSVHVAFQVFSADIISSRTLWPTTSLEHDILLFYHIVHSTTKVFVFKVEVSRHQKLCVNRARLAAGVKLFLCNGPKPMHCQLVREVSTENACLPSFQGTVLLSSDHQNSSLQYFSRSFKHDKIFLRGTELVNLSFNCKKQAPSHCVVDIVGTVSGQFLGVEVTHFEQLSDPTPACDFAGLTFIDGGESPFPLLTLCKRHCNFTVPSSAEQLFSVFSSNNTLMIIVFNFFEQPVVHFVMKSVFSYCYIIQYNPCLSLSAAKISNNFVYLALSEPIAHHMKFPYIEPTFVHPMEEVKCYLLQVAPVGGDNVTWCSLEQQMSPSFALPDPHGFQGTIEYAIKGFISDYCAPDFGSHFIHNDFKLKTVYLNGGFLFTESRYENAAREIWNHFKKENQKSEWRKNRERNSVFSIQVNSTIPYREQKPKMTFRSAVPANTWYSVHVTMDLYRVKDNILNVFNNWNPLPVAFTKRCHALMLTLDDHSATQSSFMLEVDVKYKLNSYGRALCPFQLQLSIKEQVYPNDILFLVYWGALTCHSYGRGNFAEAKIRSNGTLSHQNTISLKVRSIANLRVSDIDSAHYFVCSHATKHCSFYWYASHIGSNMYYLFLRLHTDDICCVPSCKEPETNTTPPWYSCHNHRCSAAKSWREAAQFCDETFGGTLPHFHSRSEQEQLLQILPQTEQPIEAIFIGLVREPHGKVHRKYFVLCCFYCLPLKPAQFESFFIFSSIG